MKIFNSLTKSIEEFITQDIDELRMYSCGPTVYDSAHIGNLSSYIYADTLRRALELNGYNVKHIMNYTDVDDKTIKKSIDSFPNEEPKEALSKLTKNYIDQFQNDIKKVGIDTSKIKFVKATDSIGHMQSLIKKLYDKKIAYIADDGVYFSIDAYKKSGKKYGQLLKIEESNTSSARIDNDEYDKESIHDFALWKMNKAGEPSWDLNIDGQDVSGRPGWHIECSAMSTNELGIPFDIHTGGIDLIFPHHENEIAQSTATNGELMAKYFMHNNHLLVNGKKMAKSAGNFFTLEDIIDKGFSPMAFRLFILQSHYRNESNFTWDALQASQNRLDNLQAMADMRFQVKPNDNEDPLTVFVDKIKMTMEDLSNNLNTPEALSDISSIASDNNEVIFQINEKDFLDFLELIDKAFGLNLLSSKDIEDKYKSLIAEREKARQNSDWDIADQIRNELSKNGIGLRDTSHGPVWYRINPTE
jgi:cysteinyl-tRNA synthetase